MARRLRLRDIEMVRVLTQEAANGRPITDEVKALAVEWTDMNIAKISDRQQRKEAALRKFRAAINRPGVREAIQDAFGLVNFSPVDALKMHVKHIKGEITKEVLAPDGSIKQLKIPPSFAALQAYENLALPKQPTQIHARNENVTYHMGDEIRRRDDAPPTRARTVGAAPVIIEAAGEVDEPALPEVEQEEDDDEGNGLDD